MNIQWGGGLEAGPWILQLLEALLVLATCVAHSSSCAEKNQQQSEDPCRERDVRGAEREKRLFVVAVVWMICDRKF